MGFYEEICLGPPGYGKIEEEINNGKRKVRVSIREVFKKSFELYLDDAEYEMLNRGDDSVINDLGLYDEVIFSNATLMETEYAVYDEDLGTYI